MGQKQARLFCASVNAVMVMLRWLVLRASILCVFTTSNWDPYQRINIKHQENMQNKAHISPIFCHQHFISPSYLHVVCPTFSLPTHNHLLTLFMTITSFTFKGDVSFEPVTSLAHIKVMPFGGRERVGSSCLSGLAFFSYSPVKIPRQPVNAFSVLEGSSSLSQCSDCWWWFLQEGAEHESKK